MAPTPVIGQELPSLVLDSIEARSKAKEEFRIGGFNIFWKAYQPYLADRGYTLYNVLDKNYRSMIPSSLCPPPAAHPYAFVAYHPEGTLHDYHAMSLLLYAQDKANRHVVMNIVKNGSDEHKIYQLLLACPDLHQSDCFPSVIPVLQIIPSPHDFSFVVLPRWGDSPHSPFFANVGEVLFFMESMLQGLSFLHSHRIVHRDIDFKNMLINHFSYNSRISRDERCAHRATRDVRYCFFDFDIALIVPDDVHHLPSTFSFDGSPFNHPSDVDQGETMYDPFAFDVACLGNTLSIFKHLTPRVPLLAPLFDRMTTHIVAKRFSAEESYAFCRQIRPQLSDEELSMPIPPFPDESEGLDHWQDLPVEFVKAWSDYRETPPTFVRRVLRWIGSTCIGWKMLYWVRRALGPTSNG